MQTKRYELLVESMQAKHQKQIQQNLDYQRGLESENKLLRAKLDSSQLDLQRVNNALAQKSTELLALQADYRHLHADLKSIATQLCHMLDPGQWTLVQKVEERLAGLQSKFETLKKVVLSAEVNVRNETLTQENGELREKLSRLESEAFQKDLNL